MTSTTFSIEWAGDDLNPTTVVTISLQFPSSNPEEATSELTAIITSSIISGLFISSTHGTYTMTQARPLHDPIIIELARGIQIAHAAWLAMGAPGAWPCKEESTP